MNAIKCPTPASVKFVPKFEPQLCLPCPGSGYLRLPFSCTWWLVLLAAYAIQTRPVSGTARMIVFPTFSDFPFLCFRKSSPSPVITMIHQQDFHLHRPMASDHQQLMHHAIASPVGCPGSCWALPRCSRCQCYSPGMACGFNIQKQSVRCGQELVGYGGICWDGLTLHTSLGR